MTSWRYILLFILLLTLTSCNARTGTGTALHKAAQEGRADLVTALLEGGADADAGENNERKGTHRESRDVPTRTRIHREAEKTRPADGPQPLPDERRP